jgi:hypothetical protein
MNRYRGEKTVQAVPTEATAAAVSTAISNDSAQAPKYTAAEAEHDIAVFGKMHQWDPNINPEKLDAMAHAVDAHDTKAELAMEEELEENSPYPEVQAAVALGDDPDTPAGTFRAWFLGLLFVTIGSGLNLLFSLRNPSISIGSLVAQLVSYPCGVFLAKVLPTKKFRIFGYEFSFNPGPFSKKEHTLITVMANVTFAGGAGGFFLLLLAPIWILKLIIGCL